MGQKMCSHLKLGVFDRMDRIKRFNIYEIRISLSFFKEKVLIWLHWNYISYIIAISILQNPNYIL